MELTAEQLRVLGALIEKHMTTPDHYPLTTSSLLAACNQTSNRDPVMRLDESSAITAMDSLRSLGLARTVKRAGERAIKHLEIADEGLDIDREQKAVLAVLMLRGPQTSGEVRLRTERYVAFESLEETERVLESMAAADIPVAVLLDRVPGQKEARWMHVLGGDVVSSPSNDSAVPTIAAAPGLVDRLQGLEEVVAQLTERVDLLESLLE